VKNNIDQRFDRLEAKIDKLMDDMIPTLREEMATMKAKSSNTATIITAIGGLVTLVASMAVAKFRH
jgi:enterochelin esterase-like enzyme